MSGCKEGKNMEDKIETIGNGTKIQHGHLNDRIYLIKLGKEDCPGILETISSIAGENNYSKIFCKSPGWAAPYFFADGYLTEAIIPRFYQNSEPAFFLAKYLNLDRLLELETDQLQDLGQLLKGTFQEETLPGNSGFKSMLLGPSDVKEITSIYKRVFLSYPFPIHDSRYILETMKENVRYYGIRKDRQLVALASAEVNMEDKNAEMTDFATLSGFRGKKLGQRLLARMESDMKNLGIATLYTIARLESIPMNKVFLKHQYQYGGTLVNNTNIAGKIESMNVYYKHI